MYSVMVYISILLFLYRVAYSEMDFNIDLVNIPLRRSTVYIIYFINQFHCVYSQICIFTVISVFKQVLFVTL